MRNLGLPILGLALALCLMLSLTAWVAAQEGYELSWWTADGGGQTFSAGGGYSLGGTTGQPDAGVMSGPGYTLAGGFWSGRTTIYRVYLPLALRDSP